MKNFYTIEYTRAKGLPTTARVWARDSKEAVEKVLKRKDAGDIVYVGRLSGWIFLAGMLMIITASAGFSIAKWWLKVI